MTASVHISNRMIVLPGNVIQVPGCEPTSAATSAGLAAYMREACTGSYITLKKALDVIPGSSVEFGSHGDRYFILPDGPPGDPGCPCILPNDWYDVLRKNADSPIKTEEQPPKYNPCSGFAINFNGCPNDMV